MPNDERLMNLGRLKEWEEQARVLAIKIHGLRQELRHYSDPHRSIEHLKVEEMRVALDGLYDTNQLHLDLISKIRELRDELGIKA